MAAEEAGGTIETWLRKHRLIYVGATRHPFILSIRDGRVDRSAFKRWLGQDYVFVRKLIPFVASLLLKASKESDDESDVDVLLGGMAALNDEISWFKNEASKWDVQLDKIVPQETNLEYCRFLESLMQPETEYAVSMTTFWAIEAVYQQSFAHCLEDDSNAPTELIATCERWGNEGFGQYCHSLQRIANRCLSKASDDTRARAEVALLHVLEHEVAFWNMSRGDV
ncbi:hypothetical protein V2J09_011403 [Rumex salicifolius]